MPADDAICVVCGATRIEHEQLNHQFSLTGELKPKEQKKPAVARQGVAGDTVILRLINTLAGKGLLTSEDLAQIFPPAVVRDPDGH